ncbi:tetratricopeptide repeat protein [Nonomuraea salmonea]|uniref:tetratricopeptide repeat protein n=1 Tax=Nonomuraea salmonea TaxID=46181 RepID=UPI002FEA75C7
MAHEGNGHDEKPGAPRGGVYDWYQRGVKLLKEGSPAAAAALLERAAEAEPESRSILEALARAQFNSRQYAEAAARFRQIVDANPTEDYAYFGLGLALWRTGGRGRRPGTAGYRGGHAARRQELREGVAERACDLEGPQGDVTARGAGGRAALESHAA